MKRLIFLLILVPVLLFGQSLELARWDTSATQSEAIVIDRDYYMSGILLPQSFADTLSFHVSRDGTTYYQLHDPSADSSVVYYVEVDSSATRALTFDKDVFWPWRRIKITTDIATSAAWDTVYVMTEPKRWR